MRKNKKEEGKKKGKKKHSKDTAKRFLKKELLRAIVNLFHDTPNEVMNYKQVCWKLGIDNKVQRLQVFQLMEELALGGLLAQTDKGRFRLSYTESAMVGIFRQQSRQMMFYPEQGGEPISIPEGKSAHALDGNKVKVRMLRRRGRDRKECEVVKVLENKGLDVVGTLQVNVGFSFLMPDSKQITTDIFIPNDLRNHAKHNDVVLVHVSEWPANARSPIGEVVEILGQIDENETLVQSLLLQNNIDRKYPANAERAANRIAEGITPEEIARREDFRPVPTFTIDPKDAKDFDDALSIRRLENGNWEVGVHIADVTHYVHPGTTIDKEAYARATSIYMVGCTVPMLPERLCNQICSLRPNEEKLCFSVIFELNEEAEVKNYHIARTVIESNRRFAYEEAQAIIETGEGDYKEEILALYRLSVHLREKRFAEGSVYFDRSEIGFDLDERGHVLSTYLKIPKEANKLVEEFMLLANRMVATTIGGPQNRRNRTFVYRVHDRPDPEKLENFARYVSRMGYKLDVHCPTFELSSRMNKLLEQAKGKPEEDLIASMAIRSMQKAKYTTKNIGHYGLAMKYYTHFTSPIRRYPDMMVHRLLEHYLDEGRSVSAKNYEAYCLHCTNMEIRANDIERTSIRAKQVEYMRQFIGEDFEGSVSGFNDWGIYVELIDNHCEGLLPLRDLADFYRYDEKNFCVVSRDRRHAFRLGDRVTVKVAAANMVRRQIEFSLVNPALDASLL